MTTTTNPLENLSDIDHARLMNVVLQIDSVRTLIEPLLDANSALLTDVETLRMLLKNREERREERRHVGTAAFHTLADGTLFTEAADDDIPFVERSLLVKVPMFVGDYGETNAVYISLNDDTVDFDTDGIEANTRVRVVDDLHILERVRMLIDSEVNRRVEQHEREMQQYQELTRAILSRVQSTD